MGKDKEKKKEKKEEKKGIGLNLRSLIMSKGASLSPRKSKNTKNSPTQPKRVINAPKVNLNVSPKTKQAITRFQAHVRGFLVRRADKIAGTQKQRAIQHKSLKLLLRIEQKYLGHLKILIDEYLIPCRQICKGNKKKLKKLDSIFINVESMYAFHVKFCKVIENYSEHWPACQSIGKAICDRILDFTFYEKYVNNIPFSKSAFQEMSKEKNSITTLIKDINTKRKDLWNDSHHVYRDFRTLLKLPLKHLQQYKSPLKKLMISTPENHPDYKYRVATAATFREIGLYLGHIFTESVAMQDMSIFEGRLISRTFQVLIPKRKIVRQGEMFVNNSSARRVVLCNDICVITRVMNQVTYSYEEHFELKGAKIRRLSTSSDGTKQIFTITTKEGASYTFSPSTFAKCKSWQKSFEDAISKRNDQVFGLSVEEVVQRDQSPVPRIIFSIVYRLNRGLTEDRVFRAAGDSKALRALRRRFNHHLKDLDLSNNYSQDVAALLIPYLTALPEPIFVLDYHDDVVNEREPPSDERVFTYFKKRVAELPEPNRNLFEFLVLLLHRAAFLSKREEALTTIELAVLFSPLLFKPLKWNLNYCYKMPRIARVFEKVLQHPEEIFPFKNEALPATFHQFLFADMFGDWWRRFRMGETKIVEFLAQENNLKAFIRSLVVDDFSRSEEGLKQCHGAALSCLVLTSDFIKPKFIENESLLDELISLVQSNFDREHTLRFFRDTLEAMIESHPMEMTNYFEANPNRLQILLRNINAGNVFAIFYSISNKSVRYQYPKHHRLIHLWFSEALKIYSSADSDCFYLLESLGNFIEVVLSDDAFLGSIYAAKLKEQMQSDEFFLSLFKNALLGSYPSAAVQYSLLLKNFVVKRPRYIETDDDDEDDDENDDAAESSNSASENESEDQDDDDSTSKDCPVYYPLPEIIPELMRVAHSFLDQIFAVLFEPLSDNNSSYFGIHRCRLLELLFVLVSSNELRGALFSAEVLASFWQLFLRFPSNNIVQYVIVDIFGWSANSGENFGALLKAKIPHEVGKEILAKKSSCYRGYLYSIAQKLCGCESAVQIVKAYPDWNKVQAELKQHLRENQPDDVKRRNRNLVTDRYEDRI